MMGIIITIIGIITFVWGFRVTFGFIKTDISKDPEIDKKLLSERSRYFLGRYSAGIELMAAGAGAIFLGIVLFLTK
jgi:hypothetical protein